VNDTTNAKSRTRPDAEAVAAALRRRRYRFSDEAELQTAIAQVFDAEGIAYTREFDLGPAGRVDFMLAAGLAVEVKVHDSPSKVARQAVAYCGSDLVSFLVVVTARARAANLPSEIMGKPVLTVALWKGLL